MRQQLRHSIITCFSPWTHAWPDYSRIILVGDRGGWSIDEDTKALYVMTRSLGYRTEREGWERISYRQCVFYASQFALLQAPGTRHHRTCFAYFHGYPGTGYEEFDAVFNHLLQAKDQWARIQVSHHAFRDLLLNQGLRVSQVRLIPIAIHIPWFQLVTPERRRAERERLGIPENAFVVGSFQKDGIGWGEGRSPKLIKGPDLLVQVLQEFSQKIPELFVMLSGPARGYVKERLAAAGIPYRHVHAKKFREIPRLYHTLDAYLITSRQEGGPKAVLESMASGVPLVTTRVGQAMDIVRHGQNGLMFDVEDTPGLVHGLEKIYTWSREERERIVSCGRETAEANAWEKQGPLWRDFFDDLVQARS